MQQADVSESGFTSAQATYDSRIFLQPLQHVMQSFLYLIPIFKTGNTAGVFISILFASLTSALILLAVQQACLRMIVGWVCITLYFTNPIIVSSTIQGSGVSILIFFLTLVFSYLIIWQNSRFWLALVWIGLGTALAVLSQFASLFFLILPILAALVIAYREKPRNAYYMENALWIMLTPLLYVYLVRFFFGYVFEGNPFAFYQLENGLVNSEAVKQAVSLPILPRLVSFLLEKITYLWQSNPPFILISAAALFIGVIKKKAFPAIFVGMVWIPLIIFASSRHIGIYDPGLIIANFLSVSALLFIVIAAQQLEKNRWATLIPSILLLAAWNVFQWFYFL